MLTLVEVLSPPDENTARRLLALLSPVIAGDQTLENAAA